MKGKRVIRSIILCIILILMIVKIAEITLPFKYQQEIPVYTDFSVRTSTNSNSFLSVWNTNYISQGSSNFMQVRLPLQWNGTYNFVIDWGDNQNDTITSWNQPSATHTYLPPGVYNINITGTIIGWSFNNGGDRLKLLEIIQWGSLRLTNSGGYFYGCSNLNLKATDNLNLTGITNFREFFKNCDNLGSSGNMNGWDVSSAKDMSYMFFNAYSFNQSIESWDVSQVTDMSSMFREAHAFNQPIGNWSVSKVKKMDFLFTNAYLFNHSIEAWDVSSVTDMSEMFAQARSFNQPIGSWDLSNTKDISFMFAQAVKFNQFIGNWNVSSVTNMMSLFQTAISFNQYIGNWDVSNVVDMSYTFSMAFSFDQPLADWDVSNVLNMIGMFFEAYSFNQPIGMWDVSSVTMMTGMFLQASKFNQPLGNWDVSNVINMQEMFYEATSFNQPIGEWDVSSVTDMTDMFKGVSLSTRNYDNLLVGWAQLPLKHGVVFDAGNSKYSLAAVYARELLINNFGWTITDGGFTLLNLPFVIMMIIVIGVIIFAVIKKYKGRV
ncbi:MAG: BspA family leucine-rich repeat surface protein [Candidatus Hermodarchaeota archaeon]